MMASLPKPDADESSSYESADDTVMVDSPTPSLPGPPTQSYISDLRRATNVPSTTGTAERYSRSVSPRKTPSSGPSLPSVPGAESAILPSRASVVSYTSPRLHKVPGRQLREGVIEIDSRDPSEKLETVLSHPHYQQLQSDLEEERRRRKHSEDKSIEKDAQLAEFQTRAKIESNEKDKELDEARKARRKLAGELNKIRAKGQGFYQITDEYLTDRTKSLRFSIRNFSIQYFDGELKHGVTIKASAKDFIDFYVKPVIPLQPTAFTQLFASSTSCSVLIQGILWKVLTEKVFNNFRWAGDVADDVRHLYKTLLPKSIDSCPNPEAERKFYLWSATTTNLLLEQLDLKEGSDAHERLARRKLVILDSFSDIIRPFARSMNNGFEQELLKIIGDAIALDLELCRQVARVIWVYDERVFEACTMASKKREVPGQKDVYVLVAPGLTKRGKSTGEDFKTDTSLLPMEVAHEHAWYK